MSNLSKEQFSMPSPEYPDLVKNLYQVAANKMQSCADFVEIPETAGGYDDMVLWLQSETGEIINLSKKLRKSMPENQDWSSVTPRIWKFIPSINDREYFHDYVNEGSLIIDNTNSCAPGARYLRDSNGVEVELEAEDVGELIDEINNWVPTERPERFKKPWPEKAAVWFINRI